MHRSSNWSQTKGFIWNPNNAALLITPPWTVFVCALLQYRSFGLHTRPIKTDSKRETNYVRIAESLMGTQMRQKSLYLHLFSLVLRFTGDPAKCNLIVRPASYSIQGEWKSPQTGWNSMQPAYCWIPSSVFPNHIPPLLCWVLPKESTVNQVTCNILRFYNASINFMVLWISSYEI